MSLDPLLLNLLACPIDKQALLYLAEDGNLYNPRLRRLYNVCDGIPVMLADQGETVGEDQHRDLLRRAAASRAPATLQASPADLLGGLLAGQPTDEPPAAPAADQPAVTPVAPVTPVTPVGRAARADKTGSGEDAA
jgi:uncharacterized protein YbaR (Trm112 family)